MRVLFVLALLASCASTETPAPAAPSAPAELAPGQYVVLDASQAGVASDQCSRGAPEIEDGWDLSDADAQAVERRLHELVTDTGSEPRPDFASSVRQYVGAVVDGRRVIYINAFPASMMDYDDDFDLSQVVMVCDGGADFWGVVFDPETGQFSDLDFNGFA